MKLFFMLNSTEHKNSTAHKTLSAKKLRFFCFKTHRICIYHANWHFNISMINEGLLSVTSEVVQACPGKSGKVN